MSDTPDIKIARLEEKTKAHDEKISDLEREVYEKHAARLEKMEQITARNAIIVSYVERLGWAIIVAATSSFHWLKGLFTGD